jgi:predicted permease
VVEQVLRDLRQAWRAMIHSPLLAAVVIVSLGVGIGVNTVVFSWIQALVFRPLPGVADASRFHLIEARAENGTRPGSSWLEYRDLQAQLRAFPDLFAFRMIPFNLGEASRTERTYGLLVSGNYFAALGLRPAMGRFLRADEAERPGSEPVVVISHGFWQTRLAGSPTVVGQTLRINDHDLTIIGITPDGFQGTVLGLDFDLWVPATLAPVLLKGSRELEDRSARGYYVMGKLGAGVTVAAAQGEATEAMQQLAQLFPATNAAFTVEVPEFWRASRGPQGLLLQGLAVLQGIMLVLLLAVCGNTANLLLARATGRQREIGVRLAVGAGSWRIVRLLLIENVVLGVLAAGLGTLIAIWGTQALRAMPMSTAFPVRFQTSVNEVGLAFALALGVLCAVVFGTAPAIQLARVDPQAVLRAGSSLSPRSFMRQMFMAAEVALAMVVLVAAGLFFQSLRETRDDPGFRREGVLLAAYDLTGRNLASSEAREFTARLLAELRKVAGVDSAAIATQVPLDIHGLPLRAFVLEGRARTDGAPDRVLSNVVTPGYFATLDIPLLAGTDFAELTDTSAPAQAIVNEEFVHRYIGPAQAIGRMVDIGSRGYAIAGIVRNSLYESFGEPPTPIVYLSYRDRPAMQGEIHVRTRAEDAMVLGPALGRAVRAIDLSLPVYNVRTLTQHVETNLALRRIPARMFAVLGPLLLVLAAIGIYAVVAYTVSHRTTEIGVRLALGATAGGVVAQIVRESLVVIAAGAVAGWVLVFAIYTRVLRGSLDVPAFVGVPLVLLIVATVACWVPARRAALLDPAVALRSE